MTDKEKGYYFMRFDKNTDINKIPDKINDETILNKLKEHKRLIESNIGDNRINNYYKYLVYRDEDLIDEGYSIKQICEKIRCKLEKSFSKKNEKE
jgi:hypothetical protein